MNYQIIGDMGKVLATVDHVEYVRHEQGYWNLFDARNHLLHAIKDTFVTRVQPVE